MFDKICLILVIIGSLNWGLVGLFSFDLVSFIAGGSGAILARIIVAIKKCFFIIATGFI